LPKHKDKKEWQETVWDAKLFVPEMWATVYWRPCIEVQRLSFISDKTILLMMVRDIGVRDISVIEGISIGKVLSIPVKSHYRITAKCHHYVSLEVDEFRTYAGKKKNKVWLIYAYDSETGETVSFVWGK
jgi:hypothetical protein